jgi:antitoxin (DNA-binding transcriptional repressor) of toxin-antitoxin stability system
VIEVQIPIEKFQTTCLKLVDDIQKYHSEIIITKSGKPIAKLMPIVDKQAEKSLFGYMKDSVLIHEDILEPIGENWEVDE